MWAGSDSRRSLTAFRKRKQLLRVGRKLGERQTTTAAGRCAKNTPRATFQGWTGPESGGGAAGPHINPEPPAL